MSDPISVVNNSNALRGYISTLQCNDFSKQFAKVLEIDSSRTSVKFLPSLLPATSEKKDLNSIAHDANFQRMSESNDQNISLEGNFSTNFFSFDAYAKGVISNGKESSSDEQKRNLIESNATLKRYFLPQKCVHPSIKDLKFTDQAMLELQEINEYFIKNDWKRGRKSCENFLKEFGTHVNIGTIHLGGVLYVESRGEHGEIFEDGMNENSVQKNKAGSIGLRLPKIPFVTAGINGDIKRDHLSKFQMQKSAYDGQVNSEIKMVSYGGPPSPDSLDIWKEGLREDPSSWQHIYEDSPDLSKTEAIWDIIFKLSCTAVLSKRSNIAFVLQTVAIEKARDGFITLENCANTHMAANEDVYFYNLQLIDEYIFDKGQECSIPQIRPTRNIFLDKEKTSLVINFFSKASKIQFTGETLGSCQTLIAKCIEFIECDNSGVVFEIIEWVSKRKALS